MSAPAAFGPPFDTVARRFADHVGAHTIDDLVALDTHAAEARGELGVLRATQAQASSERDGLATRLGLVEADIARLDGSGEELRRQLSEGETAEQPLVEALTGIALAAFEAAGADAIVVEAGLGGRLDATTAHPHRPVIALANIGLDHCEHLGTSLSAITSEKAAVITEGATVISASQPDAVRTVLEQTCRDANAELRWVEPLDQEWDLGLAGDLQRSNAAVARGALQALQPLGWTITEPTMRLGFARAQWNGRLQTVTWQGHPLLVDGAHNPPAAQQLAMERHRWSGEGQGLTWILGIQAHKQALEMLAPLLQPVDRAWIVPVPRHRSWNRSALVEAVPRWREQLKQADSASMALEAIQRAGPWPQPMPVLAGSLYLIGDLLACGAIQAK